MVVVILFFKNYQKMLRAHSLIGKAYTARNTTPYIFFRTRLRKITHGMTDLVQAADYLIQKAYEVLPAEDYKHFLQLCNIGCQRQIQPILIESFLINILRCKSVELSVYLTIFFRYYRYSKLELDIALGSWTDTEI